MKSKLNTRVYIVDNTIIEFKTLCLISVKEHQNKVIKPIKLTAQIQIASPPKTGVKRATIYIPAFTIVAECKYALIGVGASIASGNQIWNGNCADFVKAPNNIRMMMAGISG